MKGTPSPRLAAFLMAGVVACAQTIPTSKPTIRHHRVEEDAQFPPELRQAEDAIDKSDYATAKQLLDKLTARDDKNYRAWFDLGFLANIQGHAEESIAAYRKAVAAKPEVFESNLNLGLILARTQNQEAETFLRAATQLKPTDHAEEGLERAWFSLGRVVENQKPADAANAYREVIRLQPDSPEAHLALGSVLERQKDEKGAEEQFQRALALSSKSGDSASVGSASQAVTALANLYMAEKRFPEAETMLRKLSTAQPGDTVLHSQLGRVLAASGKYEEASSEMAAGLKLAPGDPSALRDLADLDLLSKKYAEAEPLYRQLLEAKPGDAELHYSLGKSLLDQRKFPEAQAEFMTAVQLKHDYGEAYGDLAVAADQNKAFELVAPALDARDKFLPQLPFGHFLRATAYDHLRDRKNAALEYHKFLDTANGKYPDQEWQARHRLIAIEPKK